MKRLLRTGWLFFLVLSCNSPPFGIYKPTPHPFSGEWIVLEPEASQGVCISFYIDNNDINNKGTMGSTYGGKSDTLLRYTIEENTNSKTFIITPTHESVKNDPILKGTYNFESEKLFGQRVLLILKDEQGQLIYKLKNFKAFNERPTCSTGVAPAVPAVPMKGR